MNLPGKSGEFWTWRFKWEDMTPDIESRLREATEQNDRAKLREQSD